MARRLVQRVLERVDRDDAYSHIALDAALERSTLERRDRRLATELVYGTLTWRRAIDAILADFVRQGVDQLDVPVRTALRVGVYQLVFLDRIPDHAAVDEAVEIVKSGPSRAASGLVNAVLRNVLRKDDADHWWRDRDRQQNPARYLGRRFSLPTWLAKRLLRSHDLSGAETLARAFNRRPPAYLRRIGAAGGQPEVATAADGLPDGIEPVGAVPGALRAESFGPTVRAGIDDARWCVQDLGSQLVGLYTGSDTGMAVVDGCAGLGGKALHLAELVGRAGEVVAVDPADTKIAMLTTAADRFGLAGRITTHVDTLQAWADGCDRRFERVLVDAPCSGLGVLRRHPETRWRRTEADISELVDLQAALLDAAAGLVADQGVLIYSVCTFAAEEGPRQVQRLLDRRDDLTPAGVPTAGAAGRLDWTGYVDADGHLSLNPADHDTDAFFAGRVQKSTS